MNRRSMDDLFRRVDYRADKIITFDELSDMLLPLNSKQKPVVDIDTLSNQHTENLNEDIALSTINDAVSINHCKIRNHT